MTPPMASSLDQKLNKAKYGSTSAKMSLPVTAVMYRTQASTA